MKSNIGGFLFLIGTAIMVGANPESEVWKYAIVICIAFAAIVSGYKMIKENDRK